MHFEIVFVLLLLLACNMHSLSRQQTDDDKSREQLSFIVAPQSEYRSMCGRWLVSMIVYFCLSRQKTYLFEISVCIYLELFTKWQLKWREREYALALAHIRTTQELKSHKMTKSN